MRRRTSPGFVRSRPKRTVTGPPAADLMQPEERPADAKSLKRVPGRLRRELQIAQIDAETETDPAADRHHDNRVTRERRHAHPTDEISRTLDPAIALKQRWHG